MRPYVSSFHDILHRLRDFNLLSRRIVPSCSALQLLAAERLDHQGRRITQGLCYLDVRRRGRSESDPRAGTDLNGTQAKPRSV